MHVEHGIGKYLGLKAIQIVNRPHDCLIIEYANNSKLYVPVENIKLISRYGNANVNVVEMWCTCNGDVYVHVNITCNVDVM